MATLAQASARVAAPSATACRASHVASEVHPHPERFVCTEHVGRGRSLEKRATEPETSTDKPLIAAVNDDPARRQFLVCVGCGIADLLIAEPNSPHLMPS